MTKKVFGAYAKYYDLLYKDKDYNKEAAYIKRMINKFNPECKNILNLGCGTGKHDFIFADKGFDVTGIDLSEEMVQYANDSLLKRQSAGKLKFLQGDIREISLNRKFDAVIALFHVMSYQNSNDDVLKTLINARKHLKKNGVLMFDFWYGPGVLTDRPERRIKNFSEREVSVRRYAVPRIRINENIVDVNYKIIVTTKNRKQSVTINEIHSMRYFFIPEISMFLKSAGMKLEICREWLTGKELSDRSWSAFAVAKKL